MKRATSISILCLACLISLGCNEGTSPDVSPDSGGDVQDVGDSTDLGDSPDEGEPADSGRDTGAADMGAEDVGPDDAGQNAQDVGTDVGTSDAGTTLPEGSYVIRIDTRRCPAPMCGGWWLRSANEAETTCADGSIAEECYVAEIDWAGSGYSVDQVARAEFAAGGTIVDGTIVNGVVLNADIGVLEGAAAWVAEWGEPLADSARSDFYQLADNGLQCIVEPCFNIDWTLLNTTTVGTVSGLDLSEAGADATQQALGVDAMFDGTLRAAGTIAMDEMAGPGGTFGDTFHAEQFYVPLR